MKNPIHKWTGKLKGKWENILICVCELVVGVLLLVRPLGFTVGIIAAFGLICTAAGVRLAVRYFRTDISLAAMQRDLFKGLILAGCGIFLIAGAGWFAERLAVLKVLYGVLILVMGAQKIQWTVNLLRKKKPYWYAAGISAGLAVALAVIILVNPFSESTVLWIVLGIALLAETAADAAALVLESKKKRPAKAESDSVSVQEESEND